MKIRVRIIYFLLLFMMFQSCRNDFQTGIYKSHGPSQLRYAFMYFLNGVRGYSLGSEILVNDDSTFHYQTCGNIVTGTWKIRNDSLILYAETHRFRIDSLNKTGYDGKFPKAGFSFGFKIKGDELHGIAYAIKGRVWKDDSIVEVIYPGKGRKTLNLLKLNENNNLN